MGVLEDLTANKKRVLVAVALILLLASALRFYHLQWSFSNNGIDEGIMLERALMIDHGYRLYSTLPSDQAPLALYIGAFFGGDVVSLRALVASMSILAIVACMIVSMKQKDQRAMLVTGLLLSVDFVFLRESRLFSLDAIVACFVAFSIPAFAHYIRKGSRTALALAGLFVGLATASKLLGGLALVGMILFMVLDWRREKGSLAKTSIDIALVTVVAAIPILLFMAFLGASEVFQGMILDQGQRGFDLFLKLSIVAFFGLNAAYVLPLLRAKILWKTTKELRFLLCLVGVMLAFMIVQPLVFLHHLAIMSPPMAILAGIVIADMMSPQKSDSANDSSRTFANKSRIDHTVAVAFLAASIVASAGLANYGLTSQQVPNQKVYADWLSANTDPSAFVVSGDPIINAYAHRMMPPEIVNVAYRQHEDLTLDKVVSAIEAYNVSVVIVCYRLNDIEGLNSYLTTSGYHVVVPGELGSEGALDLFQKGIAPIALYSR